MLPLSLLHEGTTLLVEVQGEQKIFFAATSALADTTQLFDLSDQFGDEDGALVGG
jgi:hypothetical protein